MRWRRVWCGRLGSAPSWAKRARSATRVTQRFGDLVGRACDVPTMILLEERRAHVDPLGQPSEVDGRARAHLVAMRANEVDQTLHLTAGTALRDPPVAPLCYSA